MTSLQKYDPIKDECNDFITFDEPIACDFNYTIDIEHESMYILAQDGFVSIDLSKNHVKRIKLSQIHNQHYHSVNGKAPTL